MKITKRQLRRIIKEEKAKVLAEQKVRRIVRRRLMEANSGFAAWEKLPKIEDRKSPEFRAVARAVPFYGYKEIPASQQEGHISIDKQGNFYLDGNDTAMSPDDVVKQFGDGPLQLTDGAPWEPADEAKYLALKALKDAGYHTRHRKGVASTHIDKAIYLAQNSLDYAVRKGGATWPKASKLLSKLSKNPNDSKTLDKLEDMIRKTRPGFERDEALDALYNIEAANSPAEKESAVDYATDYVRDAFGS